MKMIENNMECSSMCSPGLFSISTRITQGRPEKDCVTALIDHLQNESFKVGIIAIAQSLLLLMLGSAAVAYCSFSNEDNN